jgi:hypothetical protein
MTHIQRKHAMVSTSLLFSLCCLSPLSIRGISFQDILDHSEHATLLLEQDRIPFNNPFIAKEESISIPWHTVTFSFPVLTDSWARVKQELHLSHVPIYLSYLEYILLQEKKYQHAISLSILPQLFYRNFPMDSPKIAIETALQAPLPLVRPVEENSLIEDLLEARVIHPSDVQSPDSQVKLAPSDFQYTPPVQQARALVIDKKTLPNGTLHDLSQVPDIKLTRSILAEASFAEHKTTPSSEKYVQELLDSSPDYPVLKEIPISLQEFSSKESSSPIEKLAPAPDVSSSDMVPLSHHYPHTPSLNLLFTTHVQKERYLSESLRNGIKESVDIPVRTDAPPLAVQESSSVPISPFAFKSEESGLKQIPHSPVFGNHKFLKHFHLQPPIATVAQALRLTEDLIRFEHYLLPSLEPSIGWRSHQTIFVPGMANAYIECMLSFTSHSYTAAPVYMIPHQLLAEKSFLETDLDASDALVSHIATHTTLHPSPLSSLDQSAVAHLTPQPHDTIASTPLSLTQASFAHLITTPSLSHIALHMPDLPSIYPLYARAELITKNISNVLIQSRIRSPYLMEELDTIYPKIPLLNADSRFVALIVPEMENSRISKILDYPFLQEFYAPLSSGSNPFLFSYDWTHLPLAVASLLAHEKAPHNSSVSHGALSLLEEIGNEQVVDRVCYPNTPLARITPHDQAYTPTPWTLTETPDPTIVSLFYSGHAHPTFRASSLLDTCEYSHAVAVNNEKTSLPLTENILSFDLESFQQQCFYSVLGDFPDAHMPLFPRCEVSNFLAYSKSCAATLNHYSITTDQYAGHAHPTFRASSLLDMCEYSHAVAVSNEKTSLPLTENILSFDLESFQQQCSYSVLGDFPDAHKPLFPRCEVSNFLAYSKSCAATLNHYSITTDKYSARIPSQTPKLLADARLSPALVSSKIDFSPSRKNAALLNQSSRSTQENLAQLPTLQQLRTFSLSEEFSVDVQISPNSKGSGYLFAITLEPTLKQLSSGSPQNFIFLVDRSSSIDKNRLQIFKQAVNKSLLYLKEEDTFNVLTFDTEISKMSHESVFVNSSTKHGARRFLESQKRGYKYVLPNLYAILMQAHNMAKESPLPTTVVLLTNGKSLENFNTQDERLARLISINQNGFTLFTACSSQNNNTLMLEILSNLNHGEFMHSQTNAAFPRKLAAFVKHADSLIAKNIHISAAKADPHLSIEFFPDTALAPNLYGDRPYTIVGKIDDLCDFDLVLQGRFCENWLNVTKKISFKTARHGGHSIYKDYTMHVAYNKYREFLKEGNTAYLDEAKKVLQPFNTSLPY